MQSILVFCCNVNSDVYKNGAEIWRHKKYMDEKVENQQSSFSAITKDMCSIGFESFEKCFKEQMDKQNERKSKLEVFASGAGDGSEARKNWNSTEGEFV